MQSSHSLDIRIDVFSHCCSPELRALHHTNPTGFAATAAVHQAVNDSKGVDFSTDVQSSACRIRPRTFNIFSHPYSTQGIKILLFSPYKKLKLGRAHLSFDALAAAFRLGTAYKIPEWPQNALFFLSSAYPTTFEEFLVVSCGPSFRRDQMLPIIQFARTYSLDWILPVALYRFCLEMTADLCMDGMEYDGTRVVLTSADQKRYFTVHEHLKVARSTCGGPCCTSRLAEGKDLLEQGFIFPDLSFTWSPRADSQLCPPCVAEMQKWHDDQRRLVWDSLPELFGLKDWATLTVLKNTALAGGR
ncbi:hypothetical protein C8R46DRAFT_1037136 [Mycena filopes]|nr:hypothetical protein C8R46DRAFT_1037136 [Mycena filopes]